jgi:hypothetical protein
VTVPTRAPRPTRPEQELILICAGTQARRHARRERARSLLGAVDWDRMAEILDESRVLATLGPRVLQLAESHDTRDLASAVAAAIAAGCRRDALLGAVAERATGALADAGISSTVLKGPRLGEAIYGQAGRRPSTDVDLLVDPHDLADAVLTMRRIGYSAPSDHVRADGLPLLHFSVAHERGELPPIELHWRIHWYERNFARERLLAVDPRPHGWQPEPVDELIALLLFYARDGFVGVRLAADLGAWWDAFAARLPEGAIARRLKEYPRLERSTLAALAVAEQQVGVPASASMGQHRPLRTRERLAVKLAQPSPRAARAQIYAEIGLVDWLLAPRGEARELIRRHVLLPRQVRAQRARHAGSSRSTSSLGHGARVLARYALALPRLLRPQL